MKKKTSWLALALTLAVMGCGAGDEAGRDEMEPEESGQMESEMAGDSAMTDDEMGGEMEDTMEHGMPEEMMPDTTG